MIIYFLNNLLLYDKIRMLKNLQIIKVYSKKKKRGFFKMSEEEKTMRE